MLGRIKSTHLKMANKRGTFITWDRAIKLVQNIGRFVCQISIHLCIFFPNKLPVHISRGKNIANTDFNVVNPRSKLQNMSHDSDQSKRQMEVLCTSHRKLEGCRSSKEKGKAIVQSTQDQIDSHFELSGTVGSCTTYQGGGNLGNNISSRLPQNSTWKS